MPTYCYMTNDGQVVEQVHPIGHAPRAIEVDGKKAHRCFAAERQSRQPTKGWPMECIASGVNAAQREELVDLFRRNGVPTEVSKDGNPIYRSHAHRKACLKLRGFTDKSAYI